MKCFWKKSLNTVIMLGFINFGASGVLAAEPKPVLPQGPEPLLTVQSEQKVASGVRHLQYQGLLTDGKPVVINVMEADLKNKEVEVRPKLALEGTYGKRESVSSIAARSGGVAAVNGAFFSTAAPYLPVGNVVVGREIIAASDMLRTSMGWMDDKSVKFGYFNPELSLVLPSGQKLPVERLNRAASGKGLALYTPSWGALAGGGSETEVLAALVPQADGMFVVAERGLGTVAIPAGGLAVSLPPDGPGFQELQPGVAAGLAEQWDPSWEGLQHLLTSGPLLVEGGRPVFQSSQEGFTGSLLARNPRTAIGLTKDQRMLLVTVDGRQPEKSVGLTFEELAYLMAALGSETAMGLDGGGSTTAWVNGQVVNRLADGNQRLVANAIIIKSGIVVFVDAKRVYFDVPPQVESGRTLVPLRAIFEALGAEVNWDGPTRTVAAVKSGVAISLTLGSQKALVNGEEKALEVPAKELDGRTLVPIRFVGEALGALVEWDPQKIINIYSR